MEIITSFLTYLGSLWDWADTGLAILALLAAAATAIVGLTNPADGSVGAKIVKVLNFISAVNPKNVTVVPKETADAGQSDQSA